MANQTVSINLAVNGVTAALKSIQSIGSAVANLAKTVTLAGAALGGLGGVGSLAGIAAGVKQAADLGSRISDVSARTALAARDVVILEQAFRNAGLSAERVPQAVTMLSRQLVNAQEKGGEAAAAFNKLGLSIDELLKMKPAEQFKAVGNAIGNLQNPSQRAAVAMQLFGRSGSELLTLFRDPNGFAKAEKMVGGLADTIARNADSFDAISDSINSMGLKSQQFFSGLLGQIDDVVRYWLDQFESLDFTGLGEKFGAFVKLAIQMIQEGRLGEFIELTIKAGIEAGLNGLNKLIDWFSQNSELTKRILETSYWMATKAAFKLQQEFLKSINVIQKSLTAALVFAIDNAIPEINKKLKSIPILGSAYKFTAAPYIFDSLFGGDKTSWETAISAANENWTTKLLDAAVETSQKAEAAFDETFKPADWTSFLIGDESAINKLSDLVNDIIEETNATKDAVVNATQEATQAIKTVAKVSADGIEDTLTALRASVQDTANALERVSRTWWLTDAQKQTQSRSLIQQQITQAKALEAELDSTIAKYNELASQAAAAGDTKSATEFGRESTRLQNERSKTSADIQKLEIQLEAPQLDNFSDQLMAGMTELENSLGTTAENISKVFTDSLQAMRDGLSDLFYDAITGAKKSGNALNAMWIGMGKAAARALSDTVANFIMSRTVMEVMEKAHAATMLAINAATNGAFLAQETTKAAALKAALAPAALMQSILSFGAAAAVGLAAMVGVMAATGSFAEGGRVLGKKQLIMVNDDAGQRSEYVVSGKSPASNDRFLDWANSGGRIEDLLTADLARINTASANVQTVNNYTTNNNAPQIASAPQYITPEVNVWTDGGRNARRRAAEREQSKRMKQILRG